MTDAADVGEQIRRLTTRAVKEQLRTLRRYGELVERVTRGELDQEAVRREAARFAREESTRYARGLASLTLSYHDALLDLERARNDEFFAGLLGDGDAVVDVPEAPTPQRVEMVIAGPVGSEVSASFVVENRREVTADISFAVSDFVGPEGTVSFRPPMRVEPSRFSLGANEERSVRVGVPLLPQLFEVGNRYHTTIVVRGYEELEVELTVDVQAPDDASATDQGVAIRTEEASADAAGPDDAPGD